MTDILFFVFVFLIAVLYSSIGHGGASGYLAIMAFWEVVPEIMRPSALILNLFVSSIAFYSFYRYGHFKIKLLWPFIITSIPLAFIGGRLSVNTETYKIILGVFLIIAVLRMLFHPSNSKKATKTINIYFALIIGLFLGFLSGIIGIGGGIILSPVIILLGWGSIKETSAASAAFIFVNSVAGLSGMISQGAVLSPNIGYMIIVCVLGGFIGSGIGSFRLSNLHLRYVLSIVLFLASIKLILF